ncbi:unnamed protein product [Rotaria magnacalcarata]|uniref:Uncharacterized protein n=1 Tax=Rotaria magnacalcarata TaxID=392030 RepID=A0A814HZM9_9BILA|nr:unnamed protein product [Rotaria magnacalcarata]
MKIIFEHQDRKTIIIGNDYETIINKIQLLFPGENDSTVLFYDHELMDFFDFVSFDQIQDQPNGLKMIFNSSKESNDVIATDTSSSLTLNNVENQKEQNSDIKKNHRKRNRYKKRK